MPTESEVFAYLNALRESGQINMFHAPAVLVEAFGFTRMEAMDLFLAWTDTFKDN